MQVSVADERLVKRQRFEQAVVVVDRVGAGRSERARLKE